MWALIFLLGCACFDLRSRSMPVWFLVMGSIGTGIYRVCHMQHNPMLWMGGAGIGLLFFLVSKCTKEAIGYGDSWIILLLGVYLGVWNVLWLLSIAFVLVGGMALVYLAKNTYGKTISIPFVPFLAIAYAGVMYL